MTKTPIAAILLGVWTLGAATPAGAHHSQSMYDHSKRLTITGTVVRWEWANPHAMMDVMVADGKGGFEDWTIELQNPGMLERQGLQHDDIKTGQRITLLAFPADDGRNSASLVGAKLENSRVFGTGRDVTEALARR